MFARNRDIAALSELIMEVQENLLCKINALSDKVCDNRVNIEVLEQKIDTLPVVVEAIDRNFNKVQESHNAFVEKLEEDIPNIEEQLEDLKKGYKLLYKWDDSNREKFEALCEYLNVTAQCRSEHYVVEANPSASSPDFTV